jgi:hypothetical protein
VLFIDFWCFLAPLFAENSNFQKIYPVNSEIYGAIKGLFVTQGLALPSSSGPWSGDELRAMLARLDPDTLDAAEREIYGYAAGELAPPAHMVGLFFSPSLEAHAHANGKDFSLPGDFIRPLADSRPLLSFGAEFYLTPPAYGFLEIPVGTQPYFNKEKDQSPHPGSPLLANPLGVNVPFLAGATDFDLNGPYRSFAALGGRGWSFEIGRDRLSWGNGETGNYLLGDQVQYHNLLRTAWYGSRLKYSFLVSGFTYPGEYYLAWDQTENDYDIHARKKFDAVNESNHETRGLRLFIAHRLEWRALKDRLGIALSEAVMYQSASGALSLEPLLPTMLLHNLYRVDNQNSILTLEADYALRRGWNLYVQIAVDDFAVPLAEPFPRVDSDERPNQIGLMLGTKHDRPLRRGLLELSLEASYTSPFLYLNNADGAGINKTFVVANRYYNGAGFIYYPEEFLGYRWGGDALVFNLAGTYREFGRWRGKAALFFMLHGVYDKWTEYRLVYSADSPHHPRDVFLTATHEGVENYADPEAYKRDAVSTTAALSVSGFYRAGKRWELYGELNLVAVVNRGNRSGNPPALDAQVTLGTSYHF